MTHRRTAGAAAVLLALACSQASPPVFDLAAQAAPGSVAATVFLMGDGGEATSDHPAIRALRAAVRRSPDPTTVIFLGDNLYPRGLVAAGEPERAVGEARLVAQASVVSETDARALFVPGNHDWDNGHQDGLAAIARQGTFLRRIDRVRMVPADGCPGPTVLDVGERGRIIALDTQWWLHPWERPEEGSACDAGTEPAVLDALERAIREAGGRRTIVVGHHPIATGGTHEVRLDWKDHVFPLRAIWRPLWIPLPVVGSLYPLVRRAAVTAQDFPHPTNRHFRESLWTVFQRTPPDVYAAGHDHNLQVFDPTARPVVLVSGAGTSTGLRRVRLAPGSVYAASRYGFMRLELLRDGRMRLGVFEVNRRAEVVESFAVWLS